MSTIQHRILKWLSAAVWYTGAGVLLGKGTGRFFAAATELAPAWPMGVAVVSAALGILQGRTVFRDACVRNLARIRALESPRPWQFFQPRFFLALAVMIGGAAALGVLAGTGAAATAAVAGVDWLIGFSLLVSSEAFWERRRAVAVPSSDTAAHPEESAA